MINSCCVVGCTNSVGKRKGIGFFCFPLSDKARCAMWAAAVHRKNWHPKAHTRICGVHFTSGKQLR